MNIQILSDLHLELYKDRGSSFIESLDATGVDVCVLAGDITVADLIPDAMGKFCKKFSEVVYVHGNHEYYGSNYANVHNFTQTAVDENFNLHWLNTSTVTIAGQRFVGTTLWFQEDPLAPESSMSDFSCIKGFKSWVYEENKWAQKFLHERVEPEDIVITHHLPCAKSVAPKFAGSRLNSFFLCPMESCIYVQEPKLWFHGHTHEALDYVVEKTRIVCNPRGYPGENSTGFDMKKIVEV